MLWRIIRYTATLYALQVVFGGIVFLLADRRWLSAGVSLFFLGLVWLTGRSCAAESARRDKPWLGALLTGLLWQAPGLQGTLRTVTDMVGWTQYDGVTDLQDFGMETWHTVILPLLTTIPRGLVSGYYARYYIALLAVSPVLVGLFTLAASQSRTNYPIGKRVTGNI